MNESLIDAKEELKRLEHTIYVTLKYTRTIDIIKTALDKLSTISIFLIEALLEHAQEKKELTNIPRNPSMKVSLVIKMYPEDKKLLKFIDFYLFVRQVLNAKHTKREEYRRHVTLIAEFKNKTAEVDIDSLGTFQIFAYQFYDYVQELIEGKKEEND